ncbi:hypothetical protein D3C80_1428280 [compost metagenome]
MPQGTTLLANLGRRLAAHPPQPGTRQAHAILLAPRRKLLGRVTHRTSYTLQVVGMDALEHHGGVLAQHLQIDLVDVVEALAGIGKAGLAVGVQTVLIDAARHLRAEFFQQAIAHRQRLMHPPALRDIDTDRQVPHPQPLLVEHRRHQHVGNQLAAVLAQQGPLARLRPVLLHGVGKHRLAARDVTPITQAQ